MCWAETEQAGVQAAHRLWASELLPGQLGQTLPRPTDFEAATSLVTREAIAQQIPCGPDLQRQADAVQRYVDGGAPAPEAPSAAADKPTRYREAVHTIELLDSVQALAPRGARRLVRAEPLS